jgi:glycosyltransferase involved in cell wall biosynthesis
VTPRLSIVVPAFNEAERIAAALPRLVAHLPPSTELIVVDDGSRDATAAAAEKILNDVANARVLLEPHRGKGGAVRAGMLAATGDRRVFMDADLATDLEHLGELVRALDHAPVVIGTRTHPAAVVRKGTPARAAIAWGGNAVVRSLTPLDLRDTQCGFKAFRADAADTLFSLQRTNGFGFDVEVLTLEGSHVRPIADSIGVAFEVARISWRWRPNRARSAAAKLRLRTSNL